MVNNALGDRSSQLGSKEPKGLHTRFKYQRWIDNLQSSRVLEYSNGTFDI